MRTVGGDLCCSSCQYVLFTVYNHYKWHLRWFIHNMTKSRSFFFLAHCWSSWFSAGFHPPTLTRFRNIWFEYLNIYKLDFKIKKQNGLSEKYADLCEIVHIVICWCYKLFVKTCLFVKLFDHTSDPIMVPTSFHNSTHMLPLPRAVSIKEKKKSSPQLRLFKWVMFVPPPAEQKEAAFFKSDHILNWEKTEGRRQRLKPHHLSSTS